MSEQFNPADLAKAVEGVHKGFEEFKATNDQRLKELESKGGVDPILEEKLAKIDADMVKQQELLDQAVLATKRAEAKRFTVDQNGNEIDLDAKAQKWLRSINGDRHAEFDAKRMGEYKNALEAFVRRDEVRMSGQERKALSVGSDPDGGYVVYPDMSGRIVTQVFETSPMRAYASIQTISVDVFEGLFDLNEVSAGWVAETEARSETTTPDLGRWRIPVHEMYAFPFATQKLLDDSAIDIMEAWLPQKIADKFARTEAEAFVTGRGVEKPRGFLTYPDGTTLPGTIEQFSTGVNGGFAAAPNGGDVLLDALYGLKAQYRNNATWAMNRATTTLVRKLKDGDGSYLWSPGIAAGEPASLLGYPVAQFEDMPAPATGSLSIAVGDFREAYQIVDREGIRVLRDNLTNKPYVGLYSVKRVGGDVVNFEALKLVNFSA